MKTVSPGQDRTGIEGEIAGELALPPSVQAALGELVNAAKDGLLALSVGVGLGVLHERLRDSISRTPPDIVFTQAAQSAVQILVDEKLKELISRAPPKT